MQFLFPKPSMPRPDQVLPGRAEAIVHAPPALRERPLPHAALPRGLRGRRLRHGLLLGRREGVLVDPGRLGDGRRLPGRHHAQPDLPGVVHRARPATPRSCAWSTTRRPSRTSSCCGRSGRSTTRRRATGRATTSAPSTGRRSSRTRPPSWRRRRRRATCTPRELAKAGFGEITTEIREAPAFYFAEDYHQQYLAKNPNGYCPNHRTGVQLPDRRGHADGDQTASAGRGAKIFSGRDHQRPWHGGDR